MPKDAKNKEKKVKEKKENKHFFKDVKAELKKVIWPTQKQLLNNTIAVISIVVIIGVIVFVLDFCFEKVNSFGIERLKTIVQTNSVEENSTDESNEASEESTEVQETETETTNNQSEENTNNAE
jgi:preprotein translocase subunit SecE